jgi:hypothetical protein
MYRASADTGIVLNCDVARKDGPAHYYVISDNAIVSNMTVAQNVIVRSKPRHFPVASGAVDTDVFANRVIVANFRPGNTTHPFQVLGFKADADVRKKFVFLSNFGVAINDNMRMELALSSKRNVLADDAKRADFAARANLGFWMNNCGTMNHEKLPFFCAINLPGA